VKNIAAAYNSAMRVALACAWVALLLPSFSYAQPPQLSVAKFELPKASLWNPYSFKLQASAGVEPYHWRLTAGSLPRGLQLRDSGELSGVAQEQGEFDFTVRLTDNSRPPKQLTRKFTLLMETPLSALWGKRVQVNGSRLEGSVKVSNRTGRDFDLTAIVLAVNDIGRATAIGYQHFPLKKNTLDLEIPFGDTLPPGNYVVHVDVVGEEPESNRIFRARMVTGKQSIAQGP